MTKKTDSSTTVKIDWVRQLDTQVVSLSAANKMIGKSNDYYVYVIWKSYTAFPVPFYVGKGLTEGGVSYRCRSANFKLWRFANDSKQSQSEFKPMFSSASVSVRIDGQLFQSQSEAARRFNVDINMLKKRCASNSFPTWTSSEIAKNLPKDGRPGLITVEIDRICATNLALGGEG